MGAFYFNGVEVDVETDISGSSLPLETTATTFSTSEGPHHVVSLPIQRTDVREQGESEAMRCYLSGCNRAQMYAASKDF